MAVAALAVLLRDDDRDTVVSAYCSAVFTADGDPRLADLVLAEIGDDPSRFADAPEALKAYAGSAPVTRASGKKTAVLHWRVKNQRLASTGYIWAFAAFTASTSERGIAFDRAGHAVGAATAATELEPLDGDHLDARLAQCGVRPGVALVGDDDTGLERDDVVPVVPLLAFGLEGVPAGLDHPHVSHAQGAGHELGQRAPLLLDDEVVG